MHLTTMDGCDGLPPEPDWSSLFSDELDLSLAHKERGIVTREMQEAGVLSVANGHSIRRLVEYRVQYERAARHVAEHGPILKAKRAKVGQFNPCWSIKRQAGEEIRVIEVELGLPPVRRGKASMVQRAKKAQRAADAYLKPVSK